MAGYELTPEEIKLYLEEANEQLQIMEETLIALEEDPANAGLIQEIFRAAHTLKGGSATAGFDNVARLTHSMESLLDLVRQGEREMDRRSPIRCCKESTSCGAVSMPSPKRGTPTASMSLRSSSCWSRRSLDRRRSTTGRRL